MGQLTLFLLGLFAIGCVLYGISAGVWIIQRGFAYLAASARDGASNKKPLPTSLPSSAGETTVANSMQHIARPQINASMPHVEASPLQRSIGELRDIFVLYQQGGLTQAEFESMKQYLLEHIKSMPLHNH